VQEYLLFIDTEASGLPKKWDVPYSKEHNWPYAVQVSWILFTKHGQKLKEENFYISDEDFKISPSAIKIHGLTRDFLRKAGECRKEVLKQLSNDLNTYKPLIIGHFLELDLHILGADFYRAKMENPLKDLPLFCTMLATKHLVRNPDVTYLRLGELFTTLFNNGLENQHNAIVDARATSACYFELVKRGDINDEKINSQQLTLKESKTEDKKGDWIFLLLVIFFLILLIALLL
jgi:DNA polymerase III subunit epsilon